MANDGKESEALYEAHIESLGGFVYRMDDLYDAVKKQKVTGRKASDFIVTLNGENIYTEIKSIEEKDVFTFSSIRPEQYRVATRVTRAGGKYTFILHFKSFKKWCAVPAAVVLQHEKKSLKLKDVEQYQFELVA